MCQTLISILTLTASHEFCKLPDDDGSIKIHLVVAFFAFDCLNGVQHKFKLRKSRKSADDIVLKGPEYKPHSCHEQSSESATYFVQNIPGVVNRNLVLHLFSPHIHLYIKECHNVNRKLF